MDVARPASSAQGCNKEHGRSTVFRMKRNCAAEVATGQDANTCWIMQLHLPNKTVKLLISFNTVQGDAMLERAGLILLFVTGLAIAQDNDTGQSSTTALSQAAKEQLEKRTYRLYPDFVTNLAKRHSETHYLSLRVVILALNEQAARTIQHNEPLLQDKLVLLFNSKTLHDIQSPGGRQRLQEQAQTLIQKTLKQETGEDLVEAVTLQRLVVE